MAFRVLLQDHWLSDMGIVRAGYVFDEDAPLGDQLEATKAPTAAYTAATFEPVLKAFRDQRERLPGTSVLSCAEMLRSAGLIP